MDEPFAPYLGQTFGNYSLIKLLGTGGFSEVYLGTHVHLETQAAVKILRTRLNEDELERFRQEAQTIIGLGHPHLVRILDFGIRDGIPFLVMNYAPNGSLRDLYPAGSRLPLYRVVDLVKQTASVLQYAHDHQIVHRDIKPDNLLLGENNEVLLSDFGIAVTAHNTYSMKTQEAIGTVAYMAPEQLRRKARPASDQYALGIIVYEWITGEPPFEGEPIQVALQHITDPPPPLHTKRADIAASVEDVVLKALAKDPQDRFPSVQALSDALEQACQAAEAGEDRPGLVVPDKPLRSPQERPTTPEKPARRTLLKAGLIAGAAGAVAAAGVGTWQLTRLQSPATPPSFNTYANPTRTPGANVTQPPQSPSKMDAAITGMVWSPGGRLFAMTDGSGNVGVWDNNQQQIWSKNIGTKIWSLSWSPDGLGAQRLALAGDNGIVSILDALTGNLLLTYKGHASTRVLSVAWPLPVTYLPMTNTYSIPNRVISGDLNGNIHVWNPDNGQVSRKMAQAAPVMGLAFGNSYVASVGAPPGGVYSLWNLEANKYWPDEHYPNDTEHFINTSSIQGITSPSSVQAATLTAVGWSKDMQYLGMGDADGHILVSSLGGGLPWGWPCYFNGAQGQINALQWSARSNKWVTASEDGTVQIWSVPKLLNYQTSINLAPIQTYRPGGHIRALAWSPDEKYLLAGNETGHVSFFPTS